MEFFTPELLLRFGSTEDAIADAAQEDWEEASQKYREHLKAIRSQLPRGVRPLLRKVCLHDARLLLLGLREDHLAVSLFLELDTPHEQGILLAYDLTRRPKLIMHPELPRKGRRSSGFTTSSTRRKRNRRVSRTLSCLRGAEN